MGHWEHRRIGEWMPSVWVEEGAPIERLPCSGCSVCRPTVVRHLRAGYQLRGVWFKNINGEPYLSTVGAGRVISVKKDPELPYWEVRTDVGGIYRVGEYDKVDANP